MISKTLMQNKYMIHTVVQLGETESWFLSGVKKTLQIIRLFFYDIT